MADKPEGLESILHKGPAIAITGVACQKDEKTTADKAPDALSPNLSASDVDDDEAWEDESLYAECLEETNDELYTASSK